MTKPVQRIICIDIGDLSPEEVKDRVYQQQMLRRSRSNNSEDTFAALARRARRDPQGAKVMTTFSCAAIGLALVGPIGMLLGGFFGLGLAYFLTSGYADRNS